MEKDKTRPQLSVVIPAYNEGLTIEYYIAEVDRALKKIGLSYEVIVVDDGSTDLTGERAREQGAIVVSQRRNVGKGAALRMGFSHARGDIIVTLDADGSQKPREIGTLIKALKETNADVVIGTRFDRRANVRPYAISPFKRFGNILFNLMISVLTGVSISDTQSGFKVYRRNILEKLELDSQGYEIELEITFKAIKRGARIYEVPITSRARGGTEKLRLFDGLRLLLELIALRLHKV